MVLTQQQQAINHKLLKSSRDVYNSYLLLYKLNGLKLANNKSLKSVISCAIDQNQSEVKFSLEGEEYSISIQKDKDNKYNLKVIGDYSHPEIKDVSQYNGKDIITLWAQSEVSFEKDLNNNYAFAVKIKDEVRNQDLKIGGQGKKVPFSLRFANFYRVIEILEDTNTALQEKLRLANNIATGSGKTGDIALLKLSCYLANIPCITIVPTEALKEQASNFDKEFLPDSVAEEFAKSFYEEKTACLVREDIKKKCEDELRSKEIQKIKKLKKRRNIEEQSTENVVILEREMKQEIIRYIDNFQNEHKDKKDYKKEECGSECFEGYEAKTSYSWKEFQTDRRYITATFKDAFQYAWKALNSTYGQDKTCLICIDEAPNLKSNAVYLARAKEISQYRPTAIFTATPDKFLSEEFNISNQILLSPTERAELGIGKLPRVYSKSQGEGIVEAYIKKVDNTHEKLSSCDNAIAKFKEERKKTSDLSDLFLNLINQSLDSQVYKTTLIATEKKDWLGIQWTIRSCDNEQNRKEEIKKSFVNAIRELKSGLEDNQIESLVNENLNIEVGDKLHRSIKLHNIIDTFNEYKKSGMEVTEEKVSKFIEDKYGIIDYVHPEYSNENLLYNTELTRSICTLNTIQGKYKKSIERNYPGDKKLHEYIFKTYSKLTAFCKEDLHLSYFQGNFGSRNESKSDENRLNMVKAGFVPITFSKELGIGIDAPRLNSAAAIITSSSDISDPMFLLQFMGRIGRDVNSKGLCYFDLFTATKNFLNISNVAELSGKDLNKELLSNHQEYITGMNYIIETKSRALCDFIIEMIKNYDQEERKGSYILGVESYIVKEFNNINVSYGFNKEVSLKLFTKVLNSAYSELENFYTHEVITNNGINDVIKILESQDANIGVKRIDVYNNIPSLVSWAKKIIQIQPICGNELLNADPGSRDVLGKLLDANLESQDPIFVKSDSEDKYKRITEDIESYTYQPRDIKVEKLVAGGGKVLTKSERIHSENIAQVYSACDSLQAGRGTIEEAINKIKQLNINYVNPDKDGKMIISFGCVHLEILDFFIKSGLNVKDERLGLIISTCNRTKARPEILKRFIERGASLNVKDEYGNTPLHLACKSGNIELAKFLIENKVNLTSENKKGHTPLYLAAQNADSSCAKFLIECLLEADLNREMPPLLNEDRELLEHWNSCKNHIIKPAEEEFFELKKSEEAIPELQESLDDLKKASHRSVNKKIKRQEELIKQNEKEIQNKPKNIQHGKSAVYFTIAAALSALIITAAFLTQTYIILAALIIPAMIGVYGWSLYEGKKPDSKLQGNVEVAESTVTDEGLERA